MSEAGFEQPAWVTAVRSAVAEQVRQATPRAGDKSARNLAHGIANASVKGARARLRAISTAENQPSIGSEKPKRLTQIEKARPSLILPLALPGPALRRRFGANGDRQQALLDDFALGCPARADGTASVPFSILCSACPSRTGRRTFDRIGR